MLADSDRRRGNGCGLCRAVGLLMAGVLALSYAVPSLAAVEWRLRLIDAEGEGFRDTRSGPGSFEAGAVTTDASVGWRLGAQRVEVLEAALEQWALWLGLDAGRGAMKPALTWTVELEMPTGAEWGCPGTSGALAAQGRSGDWVVQASSQLPGWTWQEFQVESPPAPAGAVSYPLPLWRWLAAFRGWPQPAGLRGQSDLVLQFNGRLGNRELCPGSLPWDLSAPEPSYSLRLPAPASDAGPSLYFTALHEVAHALGLATRLQLESGALPGAVSEHFLRYVASSQQRASLFQLDREQRRQVLGQSGELSWRGAAVRRASAELQRGGVELRLEEPPEIDSSGAPSRAVAAWGPPLPEAELWPAALAVTEGEGLAEPGRVEGQNVTAGMTWLESAQWCAAALDAPGAIWVGPARGCAQRDRRRLALAGRAVGMLLVAAEDEACLETLELKPGETGDSTGARNEAALESNGPAWFPVVCVSGAAAEGVRASAELGQQARITARPQRIAGANVAGHPLLFVGQPPRAGRALTHWDYRIRTGYADGQLLHPEVAPARTLSAHLAQAALLDLGYAQPLCGDGTQQAPEECDLGQNNSDTPGSGCRTDCRLPRCGDGAADPGEGCDNGLLNSDETSDACRSSCQPAHCGDGVVDTGESCDEGAANADQSGRCRRGCQLPRCGDGIVDGQPFAEECDEGSLSAVEALSPGSRPAPDSCRPGCKLPRCGDGVVDPAFGEECDDGNQLADARCSADCQLVSSGDVAIPHDAGAEAGIGRRVLREAGAGAIGLDAATEVSIPRDASALPNSEPSANGVVSDASVEDAGALRGGGGCACGLAAPSTGRRWIWLASPAALLLRLRRRQPPEIGRR